MGLEVWGCLMWVELLTCQWYGVLGLYVVPGDRVQSNEVMAFGPIIGCESHFSEFEEKLVYMVTRWMTYLLGTTLRKLLQLGFSIVGVVICHWVAAHLNICERRVTFFIPPRKKDWELVELMWSSNAFQTLLYVTWNSPALKASAVKERDKVKYLFLLVWMRETSHPWLVGIN